MIIESLRLLNFRNYENLKIDFGKNLNIIYGENAQGKTNILEAIFLCASGRSHRTSKDTELIEMNKKEFMVSLDYCKQGSKANIEIFYSKDRKKRVKINDIPAKKIGNLMGNLTAIMFSPEDLMIIKEGPSERRRFIDITISQLKPSYFYDLQQYAKILHQRNMLLKEIHKNKSLIETLDVWSIKLVDVATRIMSVREEFINRLNIHVEKTHAKLAGGNEKLKIKYSPSINIKNKNYDEKKKIFLDVLERNTDREILKQATLYGPQRDDYEIYLNDLSVKLYGSQGQQRTSVLSIKLAEMEIIKEDTGEYPVLLLDDVMSELDCNRQEYLMDNMFNIQTFITCTDLSLFKKKNYQEYSFYNINGGEVVVV